MNQKVKTALKKAKELEKHEPLSKQKILEIYKESLDFFEQFKKLLGKDWFIKDEHKKIKVQKLKNRRKKVKK